VRFRDLAERVRPAEEAKFLLCTGADVDPNSGEPYTTNLPLYDALQEDVLLVHTWNGEPLPREHGGPVRMITPRLYAWKGAKWIVKIEFLAEDAPGFWERRGYSNSGNPWLNDRYRS
jgi:DMSO/TMAO reductase YedYZ molybdopterin-dependent catalytic subunit